MLNLKTSNYLLIFSIALFVICATLLLNNNCIYTPDSADYLILSRSLATGNGYRNMFESGNSLHFHFPLGFSVLLLPTALFPIANSIILGKIICILFGVGVLLLINSLTRRFFSPVIAVLLTFLLVLNPFYILHNAEVLSEAPYIFISLLTIILLLKTSRAISISLICAAVCAGFAALTRSIGASLILCGFFYFLINKKWKHSLVFIIIALTVFLSWTLREIHVKHQLGLQLANAGYTSFFFNMRTNPDAGIFGEIVFRIFKSIIHYFKELTHIFLPFLYLKELPVISSEISPSLSFLKKPISADLLISFLFMIPITIGVIANLFRSNKKQLLALYVFFFTGTLLIYPARNPRLLIPLLPFFWFFFFDGVVFFKQFPFKKLFPIIKGIAITTIIVSIACSSYILILLIISNISNLGFAFPSLQQSLNSQFKRSQAANWLKNNTPKNSFIISPRQEISLLSERKNVKFDSSESGSFRLTLENQPVNYIVSDAFCNISMFHLSMKSLRYFDFEKVAQFGNTVIHKVLKRSSPKKVVDDDYSSVLESLKISIAKNPNNAENHKKIGYFFFRNGELKNAADAFDSALEIGPNCAMTWFNLGSAHLDLGNYSIALQKFEKALNCNSAELAEPLVVPSIELTKLKILIQNEPDSYKNFQRLIKIAELYFQLGGYKQVIKHTDKALVLRPNSQNTFFLKANAYKKLGRDDKANEAIKDAQNASKQSAPPWRN